MKYLVNRVTKEHVIYDPLNKPSGHWWIVEADAEGWIKWEGGECPLPDDDFVLIKTSEGWSGGEFARMIYWKAGETVITAYKPNLPPSEEMPLKDCRPEQQCNDLLARLKSAHEAAQSIPDLLAELREALGPELVKMLAEERGSYKEGLDHVPEDHYKAVLRKGERFEPMEGMSDWRNWREGDRLECVRSVTDLTVGKLYKVSKDSSGLFIVDDYGDLVGLAANHKWFRFHSRPEKTK